MHDWAFYFMGGQLNFNLNVNLWPEWFHELVTKKSCCGHRSVETFSPTAKPGHCASKRGPITKNVFLLNPRLVLSGASWMRCVICQASSLALSLETDKWAVFRQYLQSLTKFLKRWWEVNKWFSNQFFLLFYFLSTAFRHCWEFQSKPIFLQRQPKWIFQGRLLLNCCHFSSEMRARNLHLLLCSSVAFKFLFSKLISLKFRTHDFETQSRLQKRN